MHTFIQVAKVYWARHWLGLAQTKLHKTQALSHEVYTLLGVELYPHTPKSYVEVQAAPPQNVTLFAD